MKFLYGKRNSDRALTKQKLGRQSTAGKTINAFIRELQKPPTGILHPKGEELPLVPLIRLGTLNM
jgi:hypothetical protein